MNDPQCNVVFALPFSLIDPFSGAARATLDWLRLGRQIGMACTGFCTSIVEASEDVCYEQLLADAGAEYTTEWVTAGASTSRLLFVACPGAPMTVFRTRSTGPVIGRDEAIAFWAVWEGFLERYRPRLVVTYPPDDLATGMIDACAGRGIRVVCMVHNLEYHDGQALETADAVLVPSEFARGVYRQRLGIDCHRLPYIVDQRRVDVGDSWQPRFVTFVNPSARKVPPSSCGSRSNCIGGGRTFPCWSWRDEET